MRDMHISNAAITSLPGASTTVTIWDSTADPAKGTTLARRRAFTGLRRGILRVYADQVVTVKFQDLAVGSTTWRTINGGGSGEATTINVYFERDWLLASDDHMVTITTVTAPTVWEISFRLVEGDRSLGQ